MISKKVLTLLALLSFFVSANATIDAEMLIYSKYNYIQGTFEQQDQLISPQNAVLVPEFKSVMFLQDDNIFKKVFSILKEKNPESYQGVTIQIKDKLPVVIVADSAAVDFETIKNELLASFAANSTITEVNFIVNNIGQTFSTADLSYPLFAFQSKDSNAAKASPIEDSLFNLPLWISIALNILLIIYLIINNKRNKAKADIK